MLDVGDEAPAFDLPNQHGETVSLDEFRGQHVVVYFYPRADTRGCTIEAEGFRDHHEEYRDLEVPVLGVSDDPVEDLAAFAEKYDLPFDLLSDESADVARAYGAWGDGHADRVTCVVGPDGDVVAVFENVDPEGHAEEVLATIR
jgi:peroxiredoxin Q/BCP